MQGQKDCKRMESTVRFKCMQSKLELYTREVNRKKDRPNDKELEYITLVVAILHVK